MLFELILYAVGFFLITLLIQFFLSIIRKNRNRGKGAIGVGRSAVIAICVMGIVSRNINYLGGARFLLAHGIEKR